MSVEYELKSPYFVYSCIILGSIIAVISFVSIYKKCIHKKHEIETPIITHEDIQEALQEPSKRSSKEPLTEV